MSNTAASFSFAPGASWIAALLVAAAVSPTWAKPAVERSAPAPVHASCSWNRPGVDPFMGDIVGAIDRYADIPADVRQRLKNRMTRRDYDDLVSIRRDRIEGSHGQRYDNAISDMHFGAGELCHTVTREAWTPSMQERGLVYCESGYCILVPTVCRNVSRIGRKEVAPAHAEAVEGPEAPPLAEAGPAPTSFAGQSGGAVGIPPGGSGLPSSIGSIAFGDAGSRAFASAAAAGTVAALGIGGGSVAGAAQPSLPDESTGSIGPAKVDLPVPAAPVPEPSTWFMMAAGLALLNQSRRHRVRTRAAASDTDR